MSESIIEGPEADVPQVGSLGCGTVKGQTETVFEWSFKTARWMEWMEWGEWRIRLGVQRTSKNWLNSSLMFWGRQPDASWAIETFVPHTESVCLQLAPNLREALAWKISGAKEEAQ